MLKESLGFRAPLDEFAVLTVYLPPGAGGGLPVSGLTAEIRDAEGGALATNLRDASSILNLYPVENGMPGYTVLSLVWHHGGERPARARRLVVKKLRKAWSPVAVATADIGNRMEGKAQHVR